MSRKAVGTIVLSIGLIGSALALPFIHSIEYQLIVLGGGVVLLGIGCGFYKVKPWRILASAVFLLATTLVDAGRWVVGKIKWRRKATPVKVKEKSPPTQLPATVSEVVRRNGSSGLRVALGVSLQKKRRKVIWHDVDAGHVLIAGTTGAGKTNMINVILFQLFARFTNSNLAHVYVVDMKNDRQEGIGLWRPLARGYISDDAMLEKFFAWAVAMMQWRHGDSATERHHIIIVVDEVAMVTRSRAVAEHLRTLATMGRSANITLIVATQHPKADVLDAHISRNLTAKICLPVDNVSQAVTVMGAAPPYLLTDPGEFWVRPRPAQYVAGKAWLVSGKEVQSLVRSLLLTDDDPAIRLLVEHYNTGDGVNKMAQRIGQSARWVAEQYRWYSELGVLESAGRGKGYRWATDLDTGIMAVRHNRPV